MKQLHKYSIITGILGLAVSFGGQMNNVELMRNFGVALCLTGIVGVLFNIALTAVKRQSKDKKKGGEK